MTQYPGFRTTEESLLVTETTSSSSSLPLLHLLTNYKPFGGFLLFAHHTTSADYLLWCPAAADCLRLLPSCQFMRKYTTAN